MKNKTLQNELHDLLGDRCSESISVRTNYAGGEDVFDPILSEAVVFPENNEEISSIVKLCNKHKTSIIPFGTGTSLEGNALGNVDGITLSLEKMNKVLSINEEDFDCRVQAYVTRKQLNEELKKQAKDEGKSMFEMPFYTEAQRVSAVQNFIKTGDADPFTEQLARQAKMTPYELLNGINNHMVGADIPVPQEVKKFTDNITKAQRDALLNYSSVQHLRRIQGGPFPLVSQTVSTLPVDTRQRGNEMLEYMLGDLNKGLTRNHAIGLLVNMQRESSLLTTNPGDGGHSDGLFQWNGPAGRLGPARAALGRDWDNWKAQIKYALEEPGYEAVVAEFLNTQWATPQQAADFWMRRWEIPKDKVGASNTHRDFIPQWMN